LKFILFIKKITPQWIKKFIWYLFKSPQRVYGFKSVWIDLRGIISYFIREITFPVFNSDLKPVTICTGLKNKSQNYLDNIVESAIKSKHPELIELSVFDCASDDINDLELAIRQKWRGKLVFKSKRINFSKAFSFNKAAEQSGNKLIFMADTDISLPEDIVYLCNKFVFGKNVWFPVMFKLFERKEMRYFEENGEWIPYGKGMFASRKKDFIKIGKFDNNFTSWGSEDWDIWLRFYKNGFFPFRSKSKEFFRILVNPE
jgi:N-terminal domain of galactosyltransferase